jgi:hypothetical protein
VSSFVEVKGGLATVTLVMQDSYRNRSVAKYGLTQTEVVQLWVVVYAEDNLIR